MKKMKLYIFNENEINFYDLLKGITVRSMKINLDQIAHLEISEYDKGKSKKTVAQYYRDRQEEFGNLNAEALAQMSQEYLIEWYKKDSFFYQFKDPLEGHEIKDHRLVDSPDDIDVELEKSTSSEEKSESSNVEENVEEDLKESGKHLRKRKSTSEDSQEENSSNKSRKEDTGADGCFKSIFVKLRGDKSEVEEPQSDCDVHFSKEIEENYRRNLRREIQLTDYERRKKRSELKKRLKEKIKDLEDELELEERRSRKKRKKENC